MDQTSGIAVYLPGPLREYANGKSSVRVEAPNLADALDLLDLEYPGLAGRILDDQGKVRRFVSIFVNEEPVSHDDPRSVPLRSGDTLHILPSVAGG